MVSGKPITIRLSCGAARLRMARARLVTSSATRIGSASSKPEEKMIAAALLRFHQLPDASCVPPTGKAVKLWVRVAISIRWPLMAMNASSATSPTNSEITGVWPALCGSYEVAKPRPICRPIMVPARSTALNTSRTAKPMANPMVSCWARSSRPAADAGSIAGIAGRIGEMARVIASPRISRTRTGRAGLLNGGALTRTARTRASGKKNATTQALISAAVRLIIARSFA